MNNIRTILFLTLIITIFSCGTKTNTIVSEQTAKEKVNTTKVVSTSNDNAPDSILFETEKIREKQQKEDIELGDIGTIGHGTGQKSKKPESGKQITESPTPIDEEVATSASAPPESIEDNRKNLVIKEIQNPKVIRESKELSEGRVIYDIPSPMKVRSTYRAFLRIAKDKATLSIYENIPQGTQVTTTEIPVTQTMDVQLIDTSPEDDKSFEIKSINSNEQIVEAGDTYTEWSWEVTPIRKGNPTLDIVISIIRNNKKKEVVYHDRVTIETDTIAQIIFFLKTKWQWILGTLVIPFIGFLYKRRKEKKEEEEKQKSPDK